MSSAELAIYLGGTRNNSNHKVDKISDKTIEACFGGGKKLRIKRKRSSKSKTTNKSPYVRNRSQSPIRSKKRENKIGKRFLKKEVDDQFVSPYIKEEKKTKKRKLAHKDYTEVKKKLLLLIDNIHNI